MTKKFIRIPPDLRHENIVFVAHEIKTHQQLVVDGNLIFTSFGAPLKNKLIQLGFTHADATDVAGV